ncbi:MAG: hypothetical protein V7700_11040 [Halioglobus sp.]
MNRLVLWAPMFVFGVGGLYLLMLFMQPGNDGRIFSNLVPELIGFCLEGFFLIGLFSLIQNRRERDRREELRQSLRGALRELLSYLDIGLLEEHSEPADSRALEEDPKMVATLIIKLAENPLELDAMAKLKEVAARNLVTVHDLIPVAAQLSANHMRWWLAITDSVRHLTEATDKSAVSSAMHQFLASLGEFDELEL